MKNNKMDAGFTLAEVLVALAISSIIMIGVFGSYLMFNNTYYFQRDLTAQSGTARNIIDIMVRDIRMAGYSLLDANGANSIIAEPVVIETPNVPNPHPGVQGTVPVDCGEGITIQYDLQDALVGGIIQNARVEKTYQAVFHQADPSRCRLQMQVTYYTIPYAVGPQNVILATATQTLADYIYDLSFEIFDTNYTHLAGRKFSGNLGAGATNYVTGTCESNIDNHTPCTQDGYNSDVGIVDVYLQMIAPKENPTLTLNPAFGRRYAYDVSTTIKLRNVGF